MVETQDKSAFLYSWMKECEKENIILCFQGDFNQELVNAILVLTERGPDIQNSTTVVRARVFSILVECMQNIRKYGASNPISNDLKPGIVIVCLKDGNYTLKTGNFITNAEVPNLKSQLDKIKSMNKEDLKEHHKKVLAETQLSEKSGAGLGLISIGRKSDGFSYIFRTIDEGISFYSLDIQIQNVTN
ncbi:MAG: SiaB family protein kinase [Bacteroidia bacterium]